MTKIRLEVESEFQALGEAFEKLLAQVQARGAAAMADGAPVDYGQVEQEVAQTIAELRREEHKVVLRALDGAAPKEEAPGRESRSKWSRNSWLLSRHLNDC